MWVETDLYMHYLSFKESWADFPQVYISDFEEKKRKKKKKKNQKSQ